MTNLLPYHFKILRYVHDIGTGEFINVGVVISSINSPAMLAKFRTDPSRLKAIFPDLDGEAFQAHMRGLQARFDAIRREDPDEPVRAGGHIDALVHAVLPKDDSSLQWWGNGSGLDEHLEQSLEELFSRFVTQYDVVPTAERRHGMDVWNRFKLALKRRNVLDHLESKRIGDADDSVAFEHAWKNGTWHCYEPISFDLGSDASIEDKAHQWLGQLTSIQNADEGFNVYFLVGKPTSAALQTAYAKAISILKKARCTQVIEEDTAQAFSEQVAQAMAAHDPRAR